MIMKIGPHKASGIDKISDRLLRIAAPVIAPSVAKLINLSFSTCKYPTRWKTAKVTPLFKSGARYDPCNYRPISAFPFCRRLLNVTCKIVFIPFSGPDYMANFSPASETNPLKIKLSITWRFFQPGAKFSPGRAELRPGLKKSNVIEKKFQPGLKSRK